LIHSHINIDIIDNISRKIIDKIIYFFIYYISDISYIYIVISDLYISAWGLMEGRRWHPRGQLHDAPRRSVFKGDPEKPKSAVVPCPAKERWKTHGETGKAYEKWQFIVDLPMKNGDLPIEIVDLPMKNCNLPIDSSWIYP